LHLHAHSKGTSTEKSGRRRLSLAAAHCLCRRRQSAALRRPISGRSNYLATGRSSGRQTGALGRRQIGLPTNCAPPLPATGAADNYRRSAGRRLASRPPSVRPHLRARACRPLGRSWGAASGWLGGAPLSLQVGATPASAKQGPGGAPSEHRVWRAFALDCPLLAGRLSAAILPVARSLAAHKLLACCLRAAHKQELSGAHSAPAHQSGRDLAADFCLEGAHFCPKRHFRPQV